MKKLTTLLLAAGMVFAASAPASAVDVKMDGQYMFSFATGEKGFNGQNLDWTGQRLRLGMTFTTSENLSGYFQVQTGISRTDSATYDWGTDNTGRDSKISTRLAYIDWVIPQTAVKVRMGKQFIGLPMDALNKNAIMNPGWGGRDGITLTAPVADWLELSAFWARCGYNSDGYDTDTSEKTDYFAAIAAMKFDGFTVTPYVMYGNVSGNVYSTDPTPVRYGFNGSNDADGVNKDGQAFWAGVTSSMTYFDPFQLKLSGAYGNMNYDGAADRSGWYMQAKASYKLGFGTPYMGAWYGSGDDADVKYAKQNWIPTNTGRFHPGLFFNGNQFGLYGGNAHHNIAGTWGLVAGIENVSFLEDLTHKFVVTWYKGTNSDANVPGGNPQNYLTPSDNLVEIGLSNTYKIYKNLSTCLEMSYIISDFDKDDHGLTGDAYDKNDWRAQLSFEYKF